MGRDLQVSDTIVIDVDPVTLYEQVADPTQMARWSPENTGARTATEGRPLDVGEVFDGTNRRGRFSWTTQCVVTASDPGRRFAFDVRKIGPRTPFIPGRIASWEYTFEDTPDGTRVTETWTDLRQGWPDWAAAILDKGATGGRTFADFQRRNIKRTLERMKAEFEGALNA
jgi:uncharacterized protein YndB with AHSA1/START domain